MPLRSKTTTGNYEDCRLDKRNARAFSVQVGNQTVLCQLNVHNTGTDESWMPPDGIELRPGYWNFTHQDFEDYGVQVAHGIRFMAVDLADPGIVSVS